MHTCTLTLTAFKDVGGLKKFLLGKIKNNWFHCLEKKNQESNILQPVIETKTRLFPNSRNLIMLITSCPDSTKDIPLFPYLLVKKWVVENASKVMVGLVHSNHVSLKTGDALIFGACPMPFLDFDNVK